MAISKESKEILRERIAKINFEVEDIKKRLDPILTQRQALDVQIKALQNQLSTLQGCRNKLKADAEG